MTILILGLILFLGSHSLSMIAEPWRDRMLARIGEQPYKIAYSIIALAGLVLIVWGFSLARTEPVLLYTPPVGLRHTALLVMVPVFPLLLAAYLPGKIKQWTGHPMLAAVSLWAIAHLLSNGMLAEVVLFGSFLVWSLADRVSMSWRKPQTAPGAPPGKWNDLIAIAAGLALYVAFILWLHRWLFGVPVIS